MVPFGAMKLDSVQPNSDLASQHAHSNSTFKVVRGLDQLDLRTSLRQRLRHVQPDGIIDHTIQIIA
jgi:hypothetical protein